MSKKINEKGKRKNGMATGGLSMGMDLYDYINSQIGDIFDSLKSDGSDPSVDPAKAIRRNQTIDIAKEIISDGGVLGGIKTLVGMKKMKAERRQATEDWSKQWMAEDEAALNKMGYASGGLTSSKAKEILNDGHANGQPLTDKQKRYFGWIAGGGVPHMKDGGLSRKKDYGSSKKPYPSVQKKDFAGGGRSYPIPTKADARDALRLAGLHHRPDVKAKVYRKYPDMKSKGKATGGMVEGPGGPREDKVKATVTDGSFIVPAKNADKAMQYGKDYLGWGNDEQASRNYPGTEERLSNGEVLFTPEEVSILSYNGIDLNSLAPAAKNKLPGNGMKDGGSKYASNQFDDFSMKMRLNNPDVTDQEIINAYDKAYPSTGDKPANNKPTFISKLKDNIPEIAGALQTAAGTAGVIKAGKMPDINVSNELRALNTKLQKEAQYGLEPGAIDAMNNEAERARRNTTNAIVGRGGSSSEVMSDLQGVLATTIGKKYEIQLADAEEKARKQGVSSNVTMALAGQEMDVKKAALDNWYRLQDVNSSLLSAGISNIIGARKLKSEQEAMKAIGNANPTFKIVREG